MSSKLEITDILGLAEPATKLIEIVSDAIGTVYEPRKIRKLADAEAYKIRKITETAKEVYFDGEIQFSDGKIVIKNSDINEDEVKSIVVTEFKRLVNENENIKKIADVAYCELENDKDQIDSELDIDWKNNFFDKGKKIYSEDLQFIFGKILAGEIKQPGTFSKRLLSILSTLSQNEAQIFSKISNLILNSYDGKQFIISNNEILKKFDIKVEEIIKLEEAGLINSNSLTISGSNLYEYGDYLINFYEQKPCFDIYMLAGSGYQLMKIMTKELNLVYLQEIKRYYNIDKMHYAIIDNKDLKDGNVCYSFGIMKAV